MFVYVDIGDRWSGRGGWRGWGCGGGGEGGGVEGFKVGFGVVLGSGRDDVWCECWGVRTLLNHVTQQTIDYIFLLPQENHKLTIF